MLLPLALLVRSWLSDPRRPAPWATSLLRGALLGSLFGDADFAVAYHSGILHAIYPWALAALLGAGIVCLAPFAYREIVVALAWNLLITSVPLDPQWYVLLASVVALIMLVMLTNATAAAQPNLHERGDFELNLGQESS
jgi:hypothetical protein